MFKSRLKGKECRVEHLGEKTKKLELPYGVYKINGNIPSWRDKELLIQGSTDAYHVLGWLESATDNEVTYTTIPLKLQKNCRAFLRGQPFGIESKINFDEKKVKPKTK